MMTDEIFGEPIMEQGDLCMFDTKEGYTIFKRGEGEVINFPREIVDKMGDGFWEGLKDRGWTEIELDIEEDLDIEDED